MPASPFADKLSQQCLLNIVSVAKRRIKKGFFAAFTSA